MGETFGWNAINCQATSVLCYSTRLLSLCLGAAAASKAHKPCRGYISPEPLCFQCQVSTLCASGIVPPARVPPYTYLPASPVVLWWGVRLREACALCLTPQSCSLRAVLHSEPVCSSLYEPALRIHGRAVLTLSVRLAQGNQSSIYSIHCMSKELLFPFPPSWPHLPVSCTNKGKTYSLHWHLDKLVTVCSGSIG